MSSSVTRPMPPPLPPRSRLVPLAPQPDGPPSAPTEHKLTTQPPPLTQAKKAAAAQAADPNFVPPKKK
jgi:hypothetical protein